MGTCVFAQDVVCEGCMPMYLGRHSGWIHWGKRAWEGRHAKKESACSIHKDHSVPCRFVSYSRGRWARWSRGPFPKCPQSAFRPRMSERTCPQLWPCLEGPHPVARLQTLRVRLRGSLLRLRGNHRGHHLCHRLHLLHLHLHASQTCLVYLVARAVSAFGLLILCAIWGAAVVCLDSCVTRPTTREDRNAFSLQRSHLSFF